MLKQIDRKIKVLPIIIFIFMWTYIIYSFSSQTADTSDSLSVEFAKFIHNIYSSITDEPNTPVSLINHYFRKFAHFFSFSVLSFSLAAGVRILGMEKSKVFAISMSVSSFYAMTDEFHQLFVPGRGGQFSDVLIDSAGAFVGVAIFLFIINKRDSAS